MEAPSLKRNLWVGDRALELYEEEGRKNLDVVLNDSSLTDMTGIFKERSREKVAHNAQTKVVCVLQREYAVVDSKVVDYVGGDDATNTVLLFLELGGFVACGHFDGPELVGLEKCGVSLMARDLEDAASLQAASEDVFQAWIVGGFLDDKNLSGAITGMLLAGLNALKRRVNLNLVCSERLNDRVGNEGVHFPIVLGAAFHKNTVIPCSFVQLGPAIGIRAALAATGKEELSSCYDHITDQIRIMFEYYELEQAGMFLECPDEFLMENLATAPAQEPPRFISTLRAALTFLKNNPNWKKFFEDGPMCFKRSEIGAWILIKK